MSPTRNGTTSSIASAPELKLFKELFGGDMSTQHGSPSRLLAVRPNGKDEKERYEDYQRYISQFIKAECPGTLKWGIDFMKQVHCVRRTTGDKADGKKGTKLSMLRFGHEVPVHQTVKRDVKGKVQDQEFDHVFWFDATPALPPNLKHDLELAQGIIGRKKK